MNLHRVHKNPDWLKVSPAERNRWQRVAMATHGILTIGNIFSILGLASVPLGLWLLVRQYAGWAGAIVLVLGRICDLLDGWLADKTGTKSPLGEALDATFDKISVFVTVVVLAVSRVLPLWIVALLTLPHIAVALVGLLAYLRHKKLHVSYFGKLSAGLGWAFLILWILSAAAGIGLSDPATWILSAAGMLTLGLSVITGTISFTGYIRDYAGRAARR